MKLLAPIDNFLLGICTKIAHNFQILTGKTNFFIAKIGIFASSIDTLIVIANYFDQILVRKTSLLSLIFNVFFNLALLLDAMGCERAEKTSNFSNERVIDPWLFLNLNHSERFRIIWFLLSVMETIRGYFCAISPKHSFADVLDAVLFPYGIAIFFYFIAIEPLSPRKSKIREWVDKLTPTTTKTVEVQVSN